MPPRQSPALPAPALAAALELTRGHTSEALRVADLADAAGYSPHHFSRMFSASMGISPAQYVTALRIDAAKRALLSSTDPVIDIATAVGFDSLSSFTRRFHDTVGVPPARLRQLAEDVAATTLSPFTLLGDSQRCVRVRLEFPGGTPSPTNGRAPTNGRSPTNTGTPRAPGVPQATWLGWFPRPYPSGLPRQGVLSWSDEVMLPLCAGNPWLLAYTVPTTVEAAELLAPLAPLVARSAAPILTPQNVALRFAASGQYSVPLLPALPRLRHIAAARR